MSFSNCWRRSNNQSSYGLELCISGKEPAVRLMRQPVSHDSGNCYVCWFAKPWRDTSKRALHDLQRTVFFASTGVGPCSAHTLVVLHQHEAQQHWKKYLNRPLPTRIANTQTCTSPGDKKNQMVRNITFMVLRRLRELQLISLEPAALSSMKCRKTA